MLKFDQTFYLSTDRVIYYNYIPDLIINLGDIPFFHYYDFLIHESFPRYVPFYGSWSWTKEPTFEKEGLKTIEKLESLYRYYNNFIYDAEDLHKLFDLLKSLPETSIRILNYVYKSVDDLKNTLNDYFKQVNTKILLYKYDMVYSQTKEAK